MKTQWAGEMHHEPTEAVVVEMLRRRWIRFASRRHCAEAALSSAVSCSLSPLCVNATF